MSALVLEFECRPAVGGYRLVTFDQAKGTLLNADDHFGPISLTPDATDDERYLAERWGGILLPQDNKARSELQMLRPHSQRTRRFDLYQAGRSAFLEFAQTPLTPDGIKAFADRYGPLMSHGDYIGGEIDDFWGHVVAYGYGDIFDMREAVALWNKGANKHYVSKLVRLLERQDIPVLWYKGQDKFSKRVRRLKRENRFFLGRPREAPGTSAKILLKRDPQTTQPRVCIRPTHLLEALWIQLCLAVDGSESLRTCVECKKWFTIKTGEGRSDKEYCSDACRMRAYRKRKAK